ncbi:c-type cytochrome biogenesis protein CcmI [Dinoroseobacter sp. PD6]|uniref:c-type cytochrome biogenesis protein CcmI n=1 Tax=Dinoroseobacter sp. PD6 TaxID=3028384 RepID=UPI00237A5F68|nr:c-type cytochrome biogenesis protein CcmI [Dinoroseobacter sp. PD6]MDD9718140.1 c-type cytochrome biogenesis protein CcmI [Dinoroseobacter sp. PD6]
MIWVIGGVLAAISVLVLVLPAWRKRGEALGRDESAMEIFKDQLSEVDRDEARNLISGDEATAARSEIKRRMLAITKRQGNTTKAKSASGGVTVLVVSALAIPVLGFVLYGMRGAPEIPSQPFAERAEEQNEASEIAQLAETLRTRLLEDRTGGPSDGWMLLGQTYMRMNRFEAAAEAFGRVAERPDADSGVHSQYAEALISAENGVVTQTASRAIAQAMQLDPMNPAAVYYRARELAQDGLLRDARASLLLRIQEAPGFEPWMEIFLETANQYGEEIGIEEPVQLQDFAPVFAARSQAATPGPSPEDVEAAEEMSGEDRAAFIRSMVEGLAARLAEEPGDLEGWLRLARAYTVLGNTEGATDAADKARALAEILPSDDPGRLATQAELNALGL